MGNLQGRVAWGLAIAFVLILSARCANSAPTQSCTAEATASGTGDALTVTALPCGTYTQVLVLKVPGVNSSAAPTLQMAGYGALPIVNADGSTLAPYTLPRAGATVTLAGNGTSWVLLANGVRDSGVVYAALRGVKCDGSTDDTAAIQALLNVSGTVQLPRGVCVVSSTLSITISGVHIRGAGSTATTIKPAAGAYNVISFAGSAAIENGGVSDLSFDNAALTSGDDIHIVNYQRVTVRSVSSTSTKTFLYNQSSNVMLAEDVNVFNVAGAYCFKFVAPGSTRSDSMAMTNVNCGGGVGSTYIGMIVDGFVNTVRMNSVAFSAPTGGGILWTNAVGAGGPPQFLFANDVEVEQSSSRGFDFQAGNTIYCANCYSNSNVEDGVYIASGVSNVNFTNSSIFLNGKYGIESYAYQGGTGTTGLTVTGGNISANSNLASGVYANILVGSTARHTLISNVNLGGTTVSYGVAIQAGALYTVINGNNYTGATTGSVNDLSGTASILGGIGSNGVAYGPSINDGGSSGTLNVTSKNGGTTGTTVSQYVASTGTANAYISLANRDGPTPTALIVSGPGDTGGIQIVPNAGGVLIGNPTGGLKGLGTINAQGLYVNGTSVGTGSITVGSTSVAGGTSGYLLYNNGGTLGNEAPSSLTTTVNGTSCPLTSSCTIGAVTSITAGTGLSGGTITSTGTISLDLGHANDWAAVQGVHLANSQAFFVGPNGTSNPAFNVDSSIASAATGVNITGSAAGNGAHINVISSTTDESLTLDGKGAGTVSLNSGGAGSITVNIASDAAQTDRTVCQNTANNQLRYGTGTLGICLGTSSRRFKNSINDLQPGLDAIMRLRPRSFHMDQAHGDTSKLYYGFIAEEGEVALPALIGRDKDGQISSFDYLGVVPVTVKAIQQLNGRVSQLEKQLRDSRAKRVK